MLTYDTLTEGHAAVSKILEDKYGAGIRVQRNAHGAHDYSMEAFRDGKLLGRVEYTVRFPGL